VVRQYPIRALERNLIQPVIRENSSHLNFTVSGQGRGRKEFWRRTGQSWCFSISGIATGIDDLGIDPLHYTDPC